MPHIVVRRAVVLLLATPLAAQEGGSAVGIPGRMDLAAGTIARLAPLLSLRAAFVPRDQGSTYGLLAGGVGLRLH